MSNYRGVMQMNVVGIVKSLPEDGFLEIEASSGEVVRTQVSMTGFEVGDEVVIPPTSEGGFTVGPMFRRAGVRSIDGKTIRTDDGQILPVPSLVEVRVQDEPNRVLSARSLEQSSSVPGSLVVSYYRRRSTEGKWSPIVSWVEPA